MNQQTTTAMIVIGTPFGNVLKFESLENLQEVITALQKMERWSQETWDESPEHPVKLAYIIKPDNLAPDDEKWLSDFTDSLPNAVDSRR